MIPRSRKIALSVVTGLLLAVLGNAYQYYYLEEKGEYERAIRRVYFETYGKEPNRRSVRNFVVLALDRYGPTEFYRIEEDYHKLFAEEEE